MQANSTISQLFPAYDDSLSASVQDSVYETFVSADKFMLKLLVMHWIAASTIAGIAYNTYLLGFVAGGLVTGIAWAVFRANPGSLASRMTMGAAFMAYSMIFIQQHMGLTEMHFHIFVSLAFLIRYKDIAPVLAAALTTAIHHVVFNIAQDAEFAIANMPLLVFSGRCGWDLVALHAGFVVFAVLVFSSIILMLTKEFIRNAEVFNIIDQLKMSAEFTAQAADYISESGQELAMNATESTNNLERSNLAVENMNTQLANLSEKTSGARDKVSKMASETVRMEDSVEELLKSSQNITSIIKTIDSIASQTNMLALNAAVEAARAGEAGAGFAVVTEEVRMLAQKTAEAASDISQLIQDNMSKAKQGNEISSKIASEIRELDGWIEEVHSVSAEQLTYLQELRNISSDLERSTQSTATNAEKNASTAEELQSQVHMLQQAIDEINEMVAGNANTVRTQKQENFNHTHESIHQSYQHKDAGHMNGNGSSKVSISNAYHNGNGNGSGYSVSPEKEHAKAISKINYDQKN